MQSFFFCEKPTKKQYDSLLQMFAQNRQCWKYEKKIRQERKCCAFCEKEGFLFYQRRQKKISGLTAPLNLPRIHRQNGKAEA
jgi:hypothetical protein